MIKRSVIGFLVLLLSACAYGAAETDLPPERALNARLPVDRGDPKLPDFSDPKCTPVEPVLCREMIAADHLPFPTLTQFSIECKQLEPREDCTVWAHNPYVYDVWSWAYCCIPMDAGTFK